MKRVIASAILATFLGIPNTAIGGIVTFRDIAAWEAAQPGQEIRRNIFAGVPDQPLNGIVQVDSNTYVGASSFQGAFYHVSPFGVGGMNDSPEFRIGFTFITPVDAFAANFYHAAMGPTPTVRITLYLEDQSQRVLFIDQPVAGFWSFYTPDLRVTGLSVYALGTGPFAIPSFSLGSVAYSIVPAPSAAILVTGGLAFAVRLRRDAAPH